MAAICELLQDSQISWEQHPNDDIVNNSALFPQQHGLFGKALIIHCQNPDSIGIAGQMALKNNVCIFMEREIHEDYVGG
ncbi:hypothetical protein M5X11_11440 [Paenibacillus alginolyticus]|uniref:Uncharacterized protein n=1 Tax=Paenibacillus alginolyticus TaxID=59839 RepID=A0ABT4G9H9_9BACL|nr:hypothetical protein [Paenibacillus alginolyticus]MCY9665568.1 hypothetical protein [Paenibacillus alginolyticus]MCY9692842.1 hypothetical protein [Paenibacillus alginolyticus]MEC0142899.1 hypothetical protein [Paenibacillus alginolyticus]